MTQKEENTAVYAIVQLSIHDVDRYFNDYSAHLGSISARHGVERIAVSQHPDVIEGTYQKENTLILKFANRAVFDAWYNDPEYQPYKKIRHSVTDPNASTIVVLPAFQG
ncbi:DUF1330 domain-containing protein [Pseudovibrio sp. POLY-S9]|uniref:DUF1330 domain-containing protein n=1 Tax=Pseudovibrio sp. POLY-S9 TaxID=1576596 RepID=UPI00070B1B43|nr:DUF1330 domain-containing protein [Pseudovibrio sp. POLY-S9]